MMEQAARAGAVAIVWWQRVPLWMLRAERPVRIMRVEEPGWADTCKVPVQQPVILQNQKNRLPALAFRSLSPQGIM